MSVAITIDFDYFIQDIDIDYTRFSESDIDRFADFLPKEIGRILREKGLNLDQATEVVRGSEHHEAYYLLENKAIKLLVNFDAHHDMYDWDEYGNVPAEFVSEGNWVRFLNPETTYIVYPKREFHHKVTEEQEELDARVVTVDDLPRFNLHVDYLFVCRSAYWMPYSKRIDEIFEEMFSVLLKECEKNSFKNL